MSRFHPISEAQAHAGRAVFPWWALFFPQKIFLLCAQRDERRTRARLTLRLAQGPQYIEAQAQAGGSQGGSQAAVW